MLQAMTSSAEKTFDPRFYPEPWDDMNALRAERQAGNAWKKMPRLSSDLLFRTLYQVFHDEAAKAYYCQTYIGDVAQYVEQYNAPDSNVRAFAKERGDKFVPASAESLVDIVHHAWEHEKKTRTYAPALGFHLPEYYQISINPVSYEANPNTLEAVVAVSEIQGKTVESVLKGDALDAAQKDNLVKEAALTGAVFGVLTGYYDAPKPDNMIVTNPGEAKPIIYHLDLETEYSRLPMQYVLKSTLEKARSHFEYCHSMEFTKGFRTRLADMMSHISEQSTVMPREMKKEYYTRAEEAHNLLDKYIDNMSFTRMMDQMTAGQINAGGPIFVAEFYLGK